MLLFFFHYEWFSNFHTCILSGLDTPDRISAVFNKGDNFCNFLFGFLHPNPNKGDNFCDSHFVTTNRTMKITCGFLFGFLHTKPFKKKGILSNRKEFAPIWSKFFPFRVAPFQKGGKNKFVRVSSLEGVSVNLKLL